MNNDKTLRGVLEHIHFRKENSPFTIATLRPKGSRRPVKIKGLLPDIEEGDEISVSGSYEMHPVYGEQLIIAQSKRIPRDPYENTVRFFVRHVAGVGEKRGRKIAETLGENALEKIADSPLLLQEECGFSAEQSEAVHQQVRRYVQGPSQVLELMKMNLTQKEIDHIARTGLSLDDLREDPFRIYYAVRDFSYQSAKKLADGLGLALNDPKRVEALAFHEIMKFSHDTGSTCISLDDLCRQTKLSWQQVQKAALSLEKRGLVATEEFRIYPQALYRAEQKIASGIYLHTFPVDQPDEEQIESIIEQIENQENIQYSPEQVHAIRELFSHSVMILNGGPGTGKSTVVRGMLRAISRLFPQSKVTLCAPTGRAARRLSEVSGHPARTIHSLLRWDPVSDSFGSDEDSQIQCDFLIVDEFSMVDTRLFAALLDALPDETKLLLIGDEEQLASVSPGRVFNDLIDSHTIATSHLKTLFRQKEGGGISILCDEIRREQPLEYLDPVDFIEAKDNILSILKNLADSQEVPDALQILAPKYAGPNGIYEINAMMQELINPFDPHKAQIVIEAEEKGEKRQVVFRVGDKILLTKNLPDLEVSNGDIGTIIEVDQKTETVIVDFENGPVEFEPDDFGILRHGWCISVHKAQGSEYRNVALVVDSEASRMLTKRLLYTAVSRAKQHLTIIGDRNQFESCCRFHGRYPRRTTLRSRLEDIFQKGSAHCNQPERSL